MNFAFLAALGISMSAILHADEFVPISRIFLSDQFDKSHTVMFPTEKPIFVAIADHAAAEPMKRWIEASKIQFGTNVHYTGVADVRKVPALLRGFVRKKFKAAYTYPILLDWSGSLAEPLNAKAGVPNVYVMSRDGKVIAKESGCVHGRETAASWCCS